MGIFDALTTAVAGLQAQSFALQNISGNIANSQTTGYKGTETSFQDLVSAASVGQQTSDGVVASSTATNTVQGAIQSTSVSTDMAINGNGWFVVAQPTGFSDNSPTFNSINFYTRAGNFQMNQNGFLVNGSGYYLMGIPIDPTTGNPVGNVPQVLQFDNNFVPAQATTAIQYQANLPSAPKSGVLNPSNFEANPLAGAPVAATIVGTGATLLADAPARGTGTVNLTVPSEPAGNLVIATGGTSYTIAISAAESLTSIESAINGTAGLGPSGALVASDDGSGHLVLTTNGANADVNSITVSGTDAASLGFGAGQNLFQPTNLLTQSAVAQGQTLTITSGGNTQTITFGTGGSQVATLAQLTTALANLPTDTPAVAVNSTVSATGNVTLTAQNPTNSITIGGTASAAKFGIHNLVALPANATVIGNDVSTFANESVDGGSITCYDSKGDPINMEFRWAQVSSGDPSTWQLFYQTNSSATGTAAAWQNVGTSFTFNANGQLSPPITSVTIPNVTVNGDALGNVQLTFGASGLTQFANASGAAQINQLQQNGFAAGQLQSISVDSQGRIAGTFSNGQTIPLAEISLATFNGQNGLQALNGSAYAATPESGPPILNATGTIVGSSLEASNVDIATQFSQLIVAQQAYSANARVMSTADQMIQSLLTVIQ